MTKTEDWNPAQYNRFADQRRQPFVDLLAMVQRQPSMRAIDLGCGTGELTARLAETLEATIHAIDSSPAMLRQAAPRATERVVFSEGDIAAARDYREYDLVFSHAALQWVPGHEAWFPSMLRSMKPGAQIAVQMPRNFDQPSHTVATRIASTTPFRDAFRAMPVPPATLRLERYAELLHECGFRQQTCIEKIYGHELDHSGDVVEWTKGTLLNAYLPLLDESLRDLFVTRYRAELLSILGDRSPYFFPFRRLLLWARAA